MTAVLSPSPKMQFFTTAKVKVADASVDKTVWATYRQALRDIPTQSGFPWEITWPDHGN